MTTSLLLLLLAAEGAPAATPLEDAATRLSGAVGIGTFGSLDSAPVFAGLDATSRLTGQPLVPLLGLRWWTPLGGRVIRRVGVEVAGGFSVSAITRETAPNGMPTQQRLPTLRSLGAHVAIPIVLVSTPNFLGHLAPEARYLAIDQVSPMPTPPLIDTMPGAQERVPGCAWPRAGRTTPWATASS
ncbi:MAG: hypothetical protein MUC96_27945 [Myxococcaceae bacterium]|nr:hypothetical protein [Myxococcaceae bacterium]